MQRPVIARWWRHLMLLVGLAGLSACAGQPHPVVDAHVEAQHYAALAPNHYTPPGPPSDPWGPYVIEASARYDVPQGWIRGVMHQESGGQQFNSDGTVTISDKGAMGLMQVMPDTYDELRSRYGFGDDPYDPHNNILAGAAYMRELYDAYGYPAFLAAYNAGPGRLDKYLANRQALPDETRRYVAAIAPNISGEQPNAPSSAGDLALNRVPVNIPAGLRYAVKMTRHGRHSVTTRAYAAASVPAARQRNQPTSAPVVLASAAPRSGHGFHLISVANADTLPVRRSAIASGGWSIQVGAFANAAQARAAANAAQGMLAAGHTTVASARVKHGTVFRARLAGLSRDAALTACTKLHHACLVISPDAQS